MAVRIFNLRMNESRMKVTVVIVGWAEGTERATLRLTGP